MRVEEDNPQLLRFYVDSNQYDFNNKYEHYAYEPAKYVVPLYTNAWNEYVRNGYNYDVAERSRQKSMQAWSIALNSVSAGVSLVSTGISAGKAINSAINAGIETFNKTATNVIDYLYGGVGNPNKTLLDVSSKGALVTGRYYDPETSAITGYGIIDESAISARNKAVGKSLLNSIESNKLGTMITTQGVSNVNSAVSAVYSIQSANAQYQNTINTKAASHTSITGNNSNYNSALDNSVEYQVWQPQEYILKNIAKIFHLTGYSHPVQEKPNVSSRKWFNYVQCTPVYDDTYISTINPLWVSDYSSRMADGVTVFHNNSTKWDFDQAYENMEVNI